MSIIQKLSGIVNEFIEKNGKLIAGTVVFSIIAAIAKDYGYLSPNYGFSNNGEFKFSMRPDATRNKDKEEDTTNDPRRLPPAVNAIQQAIVSFWRTGGGSTTWESTRVNSADSIAKLIESKRKVTESDLMFAIQAMTKIAQLSNWESTKQTINNRISRLVNSVETIAEISEDDNAGEE